MRPASGAAHECAVRWRLAGMEARILTPPAAGEDFNDMNEAGI